MMFERVMFLTRTFRAPGCVCFCISSSHCWTMDSGEMMRVAPPGRGFGRRRKRERGREREGGGRREEEEGGRRGERGEEGGERGRRERGGL